MRTQMSRSTAIRRMFGYATKHGLLLLEGKLNWRINCDDKLKAVFEKDIASRGDLDRSLRKHLSEIDGPKKLIRPVYI